MKYLQCFTDYDNLNIFIQCEFLNSFKCGACVPLQHVTALAGNPGMMASSWVMHDLLHLGPLQDPTETEGIL